MKSLPILSLLAITCWAAPIACGVLDALDSMMSNPICAVFGAGDFKKCMDKFEAELSSSDDKPLEVLQTRAICCSLTHLRKCVVDVISDHCGDKSGEVLDMVMRGAIEKIQDHSQCHDYDGNVASIICLPDWSLVLITVAIIVLALMACCSTVKMCCLERRYSQLPMAYMRR